VIVPKEVSESGLRTLLFRIHELRNRTYAAMAYDAQSRPGPPASKEQIREVEATFGFTLPAVYRSFLAIHNGWEHWSGDAALLSTGEMLRGRYARRIREWKQTEMARGNPLVLRSLVIGFSLYAGEQILIDFTSPTREGIVVWDKGQSEGFPNFYEYLLDFKAVLEQELSIGAS
jgi:hypothetical protein